MLRFKKLANKFVIPTILIAALILGGFLLFNMYQDRQEYAESLDMKGKSLSSLLETASKNPLWDYNFTDLEKIVEAIGNDKEVAIINFYDANFQWIEEVSIDKKGEEAYKDKFLHNYPKKFQKIDGNEVFALEIKKDGETAGYVELVLTDYYIRSAIRSNFIEQIIQNGIILVLLIIVITIIAKFIVKSLNKLSDATDIISNGDLNTRIELKTKDEIGQLGDKFNMMTENLLKLVTKFNATAHTLAASSEEMEASVQDSLKIVREVSQGTEDIVRSNKGQADDIQMIESSVKNITEYFEEIAESVDRTTKFSYESSELAKEGVDSVNATIETVSRINALIEKAEKIINGLAEKSAAIDESIEAINSISEKTKMLSLNASIEAARSGEAGKGFAVVAEEIKQLADQTDEITETISDRVNEIQSSVKKAVDTMRDAPKAIEEGKAMVSETVDSLSKINSSTADTADRLSEIKDNTHEQIEQAREVLVGVEHIADNSQSSVTESEHILERVKNQEEIVEDISSAASELAELGEELIKVASMFKI